MVEDPESIVAENLAFLQALPDQEDELTPHPSTEFQLFSLLPSEIRRKIWRFTLPDPRLVELPLAVKGGPRRLCCAAQTQPVSLRVCYESRQLALEHYMLIPTFDSRWLICRNCRRRGLSSPRELKSVFLCISPRDDMIGLDGWTLFMWLPSEEIDTLNRSQPLLLPSIRRLQINNFRWEMPERAWEFLEYLIEFTSSLEELHFSFYQNLTSNAFGFRLTGEAIDGALQRMKKLKDYLETLEIIEPERPSAEIFLHKHRGKCPRNRKPRWLEPSHDFRNVDEYWERVVSGPDEEEAANQG